MCALFRGKASRKRLEHERSVGGNRRHSRVFLPTSWVLLSLPNYFTTEESTNKLLYLFHDKEFVKFPTHCFLFSKTNYIFTAYHECRQRVVLSQNTLKLANHNYFSLHEKFGLHQIYMVQVWCKNVQTKVKSRANRVNTLFALEFTTPCKLVCK